MFSAQIPLKPLAILCRSLGTLLHSGVEIKKAFRIAGSKTSHPKARRAVEAVNTAIAQGEDVSTAMRAQRGAFPELMVDMVSVAEQSGALPEILVKLSQHYENNLRLRRDFLRVISWPMFQLVAAVLIIAVVIYVLGFIAELQDRGFDDVDVLGFGLLGAEGAVTWLTICFGSAAALFVVFQIAASSLQGQRALHKFLLGIPVVGHCLRSFAVARFSWAFALTQNTGMPIEESLDASLRATGNGAFIAAKPQICKDVFEGEFLSDALARSRLFPDEFLEMVRVGESSGTVPETLERLSPQFEDDARRSLSAMTAALSWFVWALVATFIIFVVFRIFLWYLDILNSTLEGI